MQQKLEKLVAMRYATEKDVETRNVDPWLPLQIKAEAEWDSRTGSVRSGANRSVWILKGPRQIVFDDS
jgi:type IV secretory pathway TrbF-like protein